MGYKLVFLVISLFCFLISVYAQKPIEVKLAPNNLLFLNDTIPPQYQNGEDELSDFLESNIKYPPILVKIKMEGSLDLKFNVDKKGIVNKVEVIRGFDPDADAEVIRVLHSMPRWTPASIKGTPVDFIQELSVTFVLTDNLIEEVKKQSKEKEYQLEKEVLPTINDKDSLSQQKGEAALAVTDSLNTDPQFPGGKEALDAYLKTNMKYPKRAIEHRIEGRVIFNIEVSAVGEITKIWLFKGIFSDCNEEAYYLIKKMPKWIPGMKDGEHVAKQVMLPIPFILPK